MRSVLIGPAARKWGEAGSWGKGMANMEECFIGLRGIDVPAVIYTKRTTVNIVQQLAVAVQRGNASCIIGTLKYAFNSELFT